MVAPSPGPASGLFAGCTGILGSSLASPGRIVLGLGNGSWTGGAGDGQINPSAISGLVNPTERAGES